MADTTFRQSIYDLLANWRGLDSLKDLFWSQLNYDRVNQTISRSGWPKAAAEALADQPAVFAEGGESGQFKILYARLAADRLRLTDERAVVNRLLREYPYALFIFSDKDQRRWHLVNVKDAPRLAKEDEERRPRLLFRRIAVGPEERVRTAAERLALLDVESIQRDLFGLSPLAVQKAHDDAFNVEAVTEGFFRDYKQVSADLQDRLRRQTKDAFWAHDYALQLLNRLMFLYFVQRKRWLDDDPDFIRNFWEAYKDNRRAKDAFFDNWLSVLFFEAFNEKFQAGRSDRQHLPDNFRNALAQAPYLNGGLFARNALDEQYATKLSDDFFETLFDQFNSQTPGFLERYNFTITEDTPFDQEVAVDPEMIGKVYESLVNITFEGVDETDQRGSAGIFYTPRVEIDLMCRLALLDYVSNHLGHEQRSLLRNALFAYDPDEKKDADTALARANLWPRLNQLLREATFLDLACGSGSFLVGMLSLLDDLQARTNAQLGQQETPYERRKRIIGQSLYGVDVMPWAVHVAELRLWLQLMVETDLHPAELKFRPLLPNLSFKIRPGDSLVQEVGGLNFSLHHAHSELPAPLKGKLTQLKAEKLKFFNGDPSAKYRTEAQLRQQELALFREILDERAKSLEEQIKTKRRKALERSATQVALLSDEKAVYNAKGVAEAEAEAEALATELEQVKAARAALKQANDVPFVWDIAFVEIFEGERGGFDMVAGNPPYVRQERIAPPNLREEDYDAAEWLELKKAYKAKLQASVGAAFPKFFGYKRRTGDYARKLDGRSDLYIYFYLHGLSLLNPDGAFVFITSNSWLDVGYGAELQEFLLKHGHVRLLIDNQIKRSFKQADVNTVIALLGAADDTRADGLEKTARFVMFKVPFEQALSPVVFAEIEGAADRLLRPEFRVIPKRQGDLLEEGLALPDEDEGKKPAKPAQYSGNRWGGKYLRAPEIYWTIVEKAMHSLKPFQQVAEIQFGIKTGVNEFFYLNDEAIAQWNIEPEFIRPAIKTPRDYYSITIPRSPATHMFWCQKEKRELKGTNALAYIQWGEKQGYDERPSCRGRKLWYALNGPTAPTMLWPSAFFERFICYECPKGYVADKVFYTITSDSLPLITRAYLNSSVVALFIEVEGYQLNHGGIFVTTEWLKRLPVLAETKADIEDIYRKITKRDILLYEDEMKHPGKQELDKAILKALGLPVSILGELQRTVADSVKGRILKARRSVTQRGRSNMDYQES